jgi:hypothetical protein
MTASSKWLAGALVLGALALPATALADPGPATPPSEDQVQAARVPYREARELHRQGKLKEALEKALEAYRIASTPVTALEAGQLLVEAGRLVEARDVVRSVALFPVSPRESEKGRESRQEAATLGATLDTRIPKIAIAGRPAGVDVSFDGRPIAASDPGAWLGVDPGPHTVLVRAGDRTCTTIEITLAQAEARTIDLHDSAVACRVDHAATPGTDPVAPPSPAAALPPAPSDPAPAPPAPPPPAHESSSSTWRWVGVAIAGAGAIDLVASGLVALGAKGKYDSVSCPAAGCSLDAYDVRENARAQADAASVAMGVGAAIVAAGAVLIIVNPSSGSSGSSAVGRPVVGVGLGSLRIAIRFP